MSSLSFQPKDITLPSGHLIHGRAEQLSDRQVDVLRPSDGLPSGQIPGGGEEAVELAVASAQKALSSSGWATRPPRERGRVLRRWADLLQTHAVELAQLEALNSTRPVTGALASDIPATIEAIRFFGEYADKLGGDIAATRSQSLGFVASEPYGIIGAIAPWNFPLSMMSWKCGPALAAGNAVILKPSELTPFSAVRAAELAIEAGMPAGIFNIVHGFGHEVGAALVRHPKIAKVSFTGSTRTGSAILADIAASGIKPVTLELGGKSPQIVFEQVDDLQHTADCIVRGFTANAGQACVAGTRLIVHERLLVPLLEIIVEMIKPLAPNVTWDAETSYSPIISRKQADRIDALVNESVSGGAELLYGGGLFEGTGGGAFYRPTLIHRVNADTPAVREELFGPVLTVQTFRDEDEGIALAAHPIYGLAAGIHTSNLGQAMRAMRGTAAGTVWINRYNRSGDMIIPTGGFGQSGIGKDLGRQAMEANMRQKSVLMDF